jgi:uncharacterized protein YndB with AHSA1/START domain
MGPVTAEIDIDVPRGEAFAAISDLALRPAFTDHFLDEFHLTRIESSGIGAGARFRIRSPLRSFRMDTVIEELEPPFKLVEHGNGGRVNRIPTITVWEVLEAPGGLATVRVSQWTRPTNPIDRALEVLSGNARSLERGWREALRRLRDQLESGAAAPPALALAGGNRYATGIP